MKRSGEIGVILDPCYYEFPTVYVQAKGKGNHGLLHTTLSRSGLQKRKRHKTSRCPLSYFASINTPQ